MSETPMIDKEAQAAYEWMPKGYVMLGRGNADPGEREFVVPCCGFFEGITFDPEWIHNSHELETYSGDWGCFYCAPVGSEIAKLNGYTPEPEDIELLPEDDLERQQIRPFDYIMNYFPRAQLAKAKHSYDANIKHNGKEGMVWASDKSVGDGNQIIRHLMQAFDCHKRGDSEGAEYHLKCVAWRGDELYERYARKMEPFNKL